MYLRRVRVKRCIGKKREEEEEGKGGLEREKETREHTRVNEADGDANCITREQNEATRGASEASRGT